MIIFTDIDINSIVNYWGSHPDMCDKIYPINIANFNTTIPLLYGVVPDLAYFTREATQDYNGDLFDYQYAQYLLNGPGRLPMIKVATREFIHGNYLWVCLVDRNPYIDSLVESFSNVLLTRDGIDSTIVNSLEDLEILDKSKSTMSVRGLMVMNDDMNALYAQYPASIDEVINL